MELEAPRKDAAKEAAGEDAGKPEEAWSAYETVFTNAKAGMGGVDREVVKKVVYEMSKGSRFFNNEQKKEALVKEKVERLRKQAAEVSSITKAAWQKAAEKLVTELEASRDLSKTWMHVDMDAFYAAVETLDDPSLATKPVAVGGIGMICTANYEARKYGVRAAMPGFIGCRLCPELHFVKPDFEKYTRVSEQTREVFQEYDPNFIARSLDEAYLDITSVCEQRGMSAAEVAEEVRRKVQERTKVTCSAGVGPNRLLAKVCSDIKKPNGQYVLSNDRSAVMEFISNLPTRKICGIGKVCERILREVLGITSCSHLLEHKAMIYGLFSSISSHYYLSVGLGLGGSEAPKEEHRKSMSTERTFAALSLEGDLIMKLEELAHSLSEDLLRENLHGRNLTLKLKTTNFEVRTRAVTLSSYIYAKEDIMKHALSLLKAELPISIRLMGLRMSHFKEDKSRLPPGQRTLHTAFKACQESPPSKPQEETISDTEEDSPREPSQTATGRATSSYVRALAATADFISRGPQQSTPEEEVKTDRVKGIACPRCTYENLSRLLKCEVCGGPLREPATGFSVEGKGQRSMQEFVRRAEKVPCMGGMSQDACHQANPSPSLQDWLPESLNQAGTASVCCLGDAFSKSEDCTPSNKETERKVRVCEKCGAHVCEGVESQEHEDFHFAQQLALGSGGEGLGPAAQVATRIDSKPKPTRLRRNEGAKGRTTPQKRAGVGPLDSLLTKRHRT